MKRKKGRREAELKEGCTGGEREGRRERSGGQREGRRERSGWGRRKWKEGGDVCISIA